MFVEPSDLVEELSGRGGDPFERFMRSLIEAEAGTHGITVTEIDWDHVVTAKDQGRDLVIRTGHQDEKPRFIPAVNTAELCRLMAIDYEAETFTVHVIDFADDGAERAFHHDIFAYRRLLRDDYERLLREAGFRDISFYGGFGFELYSKTGSRRLIIVAER